MRALGDADRPRRADGVPHGFLIEIVVEDDHPRVATVGNVDEALGIDSNRVWRTELQRPVAARADRLHETAVFVVLHDARIAIAIRNEDVALRIPRDVGRTVEGVRTVAA